MVAAAATRSSRSRSASLTQGRRASIRISLRGKESHYLADLVSVVVDGGPVAPWSWHSVALDRKGLELQCISSPHRLSTGRHDGWGEELTPFLTYRRLRGAECLSGFWAATGR